MVKHGTYRIDAPPLFQGTWTVTVDRVHYRFNHLRMYVAFRRPASSNSHPPRCPRA